MRVCVYAHALLKGWGWSSGLLSKESVFKSGHGLLLGICILHISEKSWHGARVHEITRNIFSSSGKKNKETTRQGDIIDKTEKNQFLVQSQMICTVYFFRPKIVSEHQLTPSVPGLSSVCNIFLLVKAELTGCRHPCYPDQAVSSLGQALSGGDVWTLRKGEMCPGCILDLCRWAIVLPPSFVKRQAVKHYFKRRESGCCVVFSPFVLLFFLFPHFCNMILE